MAKLWAARFGKETDSTVNDFNSSISFDSRLYKEDITGSMAHAAMLGKQGIIENGETEKIIEGLKGILSDLESGTLQFSEEYEDVHMNICVRSAASAAISPFRSLPLQSTRTLTFLRMRSLTRIQRWLLSAVPAARALISRRASPARMNTMHSTAGSHSSMILQRRQKTSMPARVTWN